MDLSMYHLTAALQDEIFIPGMPYCSGDMILTICHYIIKLCSSRGDQQDDKVITLLEKLSDTVEDDRTDLFENRSFAILLRSFVTELKVFFKVPNSKGITLNPIELLAVFIDFLLEIYDGIRDGISAYNDSFVSCQTELKFLITFLGDKPVSHPTSLDENKNVLTDIEAVANDVGSFLYSFFFNTAEKDWMRDDRSTDLALADILGKVEQVKEKIKEQCVAVSWKMLTPKTSVVSLFLFDSLLDDLNLIMIQKYETSIDVKDRIRTIIEELKSLRSFLQDMEVRKHPELEGFLIQTSDIAYEVLYILTSYAPVWYLNLRLPQVMEKIKLIKLPVEKLNKYQTEQVSSQDIVVDFHADANRIAGMLKDVENPRQKAPSIKEDISVGLDDEANEITEILIGNQKEQQIISIWGMPGLGKTTLAKKIFSDDRIVQHFHIRASCVISHTYDKKNTLIAILTSMSSLERDELSELDEDTLGGKLYQSLCGEGIRYLIILDDIWEDVWSDLHRYFPENQSGSRILFTTRFEKIGFQASDKSIVRNLRFLTDDECWKLLQMKVFHDVPCPLELVNIGMNIARNCDGLPLAVVVIAAVLANMKKNKTNWEEVAESSSTHISKDNSCMKILELSYNYLPMHLKPCFLYFGAFAEATEIPVQKLTSLWVAEGFVERVKHKNSNLVSYGYLTDLISRGLVLVGKRRSDGGVKTCYVHDLLREMCLTIAEKDNFMKVIQDQLPIYVPHHRLSILSSSITPFSRPFGLHVRSLLGYLPEPSRFIFSNMELVKVLDLSTEWSQGTKIGKLELLRFLSTSAMPSSIGKCRNLEYLFLDTMKNGELPNLIFKMEKLRCVHFKGQISWREREIIDESFQINNLEAFSTFLIKDENDMKILRYSPFLRRLKCKFVSVSNSANPNYYPTLNFLNHLESLSIISNLISLPLNLRKLTLTRLKLNSNEMKMIGELQKLVVLKLESASIEDNEWNPNEGEFQQLRFLKLHTMGVELKVSSDHFPRLEKLVLTRFRMAIPSSLGDILTLVKIEVRWCTNEVEESALKILEEQQDNGNELLKVKIVGLNIQVINKLRTLFLLM
ncbi:Disease resistance RPP8-like protein 3 [Abeliophyllum distichum]|uniref:Disease resistance RPP8-like protein 3 n=1 Tax=Abeliophyllum distichum TaxID=126358 RepID=A0ABD1W1V6_9LAMI